MPVLCSVASAFFFFFKCNSPGILSLTGFFSVMEHILSLASPPLCHFRKIITDNDLVALVPLPDFSLDVTSSGKVITNLQV